jgi:hypothetical protein
MKLILKTRVAPDPKRMDQKAKMRKTRVKIDKPQCKVEGCLNEAHRGLDPF